MAMQIGARYLIKVSYCDSTSWVRANKDGRTYELVSDKRTATQFCCMSDAERIIKQCKIQEKFASLESAFDYNVKSKTPFSFSS